MGSLTYPPSRFQPHNINFMGHSYQNNAIGVLSQQFRMDAYVRQYFNIQAGNTTNRALYGSRLTNDQAGQGGYCTVLQQVPKSQRTATLTSGGQYPGQGGVCVLVWGINDLGGLVPAADTGTVMTQVRTAVKHALRGVISRCLASSVHEAGGAEQSGQWAFGAGFSSVANTTSNSGTAYRNATTTTTATATFTIPADFPGGTITIGLVPAAGTFGGTITWSGSASQGTSGTTSTSNIMPLASGNHGHMVKRITGLVASDAGKTIIGTVTQVDASGSVGIDYAQIEATANPNLIVVANVARLRDNAAYAGYGGYWGGTATPGSTGDGDVAVMNGDFASVIGEFAGQPVVLADIDTAIGKVAGNYTVDGVHPNELGAPLAGLAICNAITSAPVAFQAVMTEFPGGAGLRVPRQTQQIYTSPTFSGTTTFTLTTTGAMYAIPFISTGGNVQRQEDRFLNYVWEVTTAGTGSSVRLGIYDDENWNHYPTCLVEECASGVIATTATGSKFNGSSRVLDFGLYWLVMKVEAAGSVNAAVRAISGPTFPGMVYLPFGSPPLTAFAGWSVAGSAGALPATFPGGGGQNGALPLVGMQAY